MFKSNKIKKILVIFCILCITLTHCIPILADDEDENEINQEELQELVVESTAKPSEEPNLNARAAIIYDRTTKEVIWGKNEKVKKAMASTTKIMTAIVVLEKSNLSDVVTISKRAANIGGSRLKVKEGDKICVNDLLYGLMLRSGNDTAIALAEYVGGSVEGFANLMNEKAIDLGLTNTHFVTPHGLDDENHYTTAYELAILTDYALNNPTFSKIVNTKSTTITTNGTSRTISNTNELLGYMEGVNGVKTGFTNGAGRCLVTSCTRNNNQIITVVLGCDTKKKRTLDSSKLIQYAFENYTRINLEEKIKNEFENWKQINTKRIYIKKAEIQNIELILGEIKRKIIPIKKGEEKNIKIEINAIYEYKAPVEKGTKIGNIIIKNNDEIIETIDILCEKRVEKKTIKNYFKYLLSIYAKMNLL